MKNINKMLASICLFSGFLACGCAVASNPREVLDKFLDASLHGKTEDAYRYISSKDKAVKEYKEYFAEQSTKDNVYAGVFTNSITYKIGEVTVKGDDAYADVSVTMPDLGTVLLGTLGAAFSGASEKELEKTFADKFKDKEMPMTTTTTKFTLIKEADGWKVFLGWEKDSLLFMAGKLKEENKLEGALKKYDEVLALDSEVVEAELGKKEVTEQIKSFEEKQSYIKNLVIKEFRVGEGSKFGLGDPEPAIYGKIINNGDKTLKEVEITIYYLGPNEKPIAEKKYWPVNESSFSSEDSSPLRPGYIKEFGYIVGDKVPSEWSKKAQAKITNIEFGIS